MREESNLENDGGEEQVSLEEFNSMDYMEKYDYVTVWMEDLVKEITLLARKISVQQEKRSEIEERMKSLMGSKEMQIVKSEMIVRDIMKSALNGSFYDIFVKEKSPLKRWLV